MIVCKFGGTSVATAASAKNIKKILDDNPNRKIVVVSALGVCDEFNYKITDKLFELFHAAECGFDYQKIIESVFFRYDKLSKQLGVNINWFKEKQRLLNAIKNRNYTKEYVCSRGEYYSALVYSKYLQCDFVDAKNYIIFNKNGKIDLKMTKKRLKTIILKKNVVIGGYYGADVCGNIKTFDRGGSDITGAIIARLLNCEIYENFTDVNGIYDKNPNIFSNSNYLPVLGYKSAITMADNGNEVVHKDALCYMNNANSVLIIKSTNNYKALGTIVVSSNISNANLFVCRSKMLCVIVNAFSANLLTQLSKICEIFKTIKHNKKHIILIRCMYYPNDKLKELFGDVAIFDVVVYSLFTQTLINKNNLKIINKIKKNIKKYNIYSNFVSFFNNFLIISDLKNDKFVLDIINKNIN